MAKARLYGQVTRLVPADHQRGLAPRLFFLPSDRDACRYIDGQHQAASGELHVYGPIEAYEVGGACVVEYDPKDPSIAPKLVPLEVPPEAKPAVTAEGEELDPDHFTA